MTLTESMHCSLCTVTVLCTRLNITEATGSRRMRCLRYITHVAWWEVRIETSVARPGGLGADGNQTLEWALRKMWVGLRPLAFWGCGLESRKGHRCLSLVSVVCCQEGFSASDWYLAQRSPTECGVSECDVKPRQWGGPGVKGAVVPKKESSGIYMGDVLCLLCYILLCNLNPNNFPDTKLIECNINYTNTSTPTCTFLTSLLDYSANKFLNSYFVLHN
jgi:hypothetical protein